MALPLGELGKDAGIVPPGGIQAIFATKTRLADLVAAYMDCLPAGGSLKPRRIEQELMHVAHGHRFLSPREARLSATLPSDYGKFGFDLWFEVRTSRDARHLISITANFDVQCATDTSSLFLRRTVSDGAR